MKKALLILCAILVIGSACNNKTGSGKGPLKGKLVIKELCAHYVVQVTEGTVDTSRVANGWKDEKRNQTYDNVFTISNRCTFPAAELKEGDEFEFTFDSIPAPEDCIVCLAFYPTPEKRNAVKITKK